MVLRQHRLSSHPPFERADSELQSGAMPQGEPDVSTDKTAHTVRQSQNPYPPALGRAAQKAHQLSSSQKDAETARPLGSLRIEKISFYVSCWSSSKNVVAIPYSE